MAGERPRRAADRGRTVGADSTEHPAATDMDKETLTKQIENMKYQAAMERWPLSKSIAS